jgi:hypothetical protein
VSVQRPPVATPDVDLHLFFSQGPRVLRRSWVVATAVGESVGFLIPAVVGVLALDLHPALSLVLMVLAGVGEGVVLGTAQSGVLRREFLGFSRLAWTGATAFGAGIAWFLGMLPSTFYPLWRDWSPWVTVPLGALLALILLSSVGLAQWTVLRHHVARSRTWAPANAVAWAAGLGVLAGIVVPLWSAGQPTVLVIAIGALGGLAMALIVAVVTGFWLARLVAPRAGHTTTAPQAPSGVSRTDWAALAEPTDGFRVFDPLLLDDLPQPVLRWMRHTVVPGAALFTGLDVEWRGHLLLRGSWRAFCSRQRATLSRGFVWSARCRMAGLPVSGFDRYTRAAGEMRWRVLRGITLVGESGDEVSRSQAGRHAAELLAALPAVALAPSVRWEAVDRSRAVAHIRMGDEDQAVTVTVDPLGRLRQVEMERWGTPPGEPYGRYPFGALLSEERRFDSYLVPTEVVAGWHIGTKRWDEGIFLRYRVVRCSFH